MEMFKNKFLMKLIVAIFLMISLFSFMTPNKVYAEADDEVWGGVLLNPITKLFVAIGDGIMEILHNSVQSQDAAIIKINGHKDWAYYVAIVTGVIVGIIAACAFIAAIVGGSFAIAAAASKLLGASLAVKGISFGLVASAGIVGTVAGIGVAKNIIPEDIYLPAFSVSAEQIFRDEIALFDVNFFNPGEYTRKEVKYEVIETKGENGKDLNSSGPNMFYNHYNTKIEELDLYFPVNKKGRYGNVSELITLVNNNGIFQEQGLKIHDSYYFKVWYPFDDGCYVDIYESDKETSWKYRIVCKTQNKKLTNKDQVIDVYRNTLHINIGTVNTKEIDFNLEKFYNDIHLEDVYIPIKKIDDIAGEYPQFKEWKDDVISSGYEIKKDSDYFSMTHSDNVYTIYIHEKKENEYNTKYTLTFSYDEDNKTYLTTLNTSGQEEIIQVDSTAKQLRGIITTWYFILRNIALLVLMLILIYSGIRIVIGSTAGEKAKYKERLMDWLVALCLVMIMHYIMVFAVELVSKFIDLVASSTDGNVAYIQLTDVQEKNAKEILEGYVTTPEGGDAILYDGEKGATGCGDNGTLVWPTDLAGLFRIQTQITESGTYLWLGYSICYCVLVLFTLFFAWTYLRRVLYMAFLTIIAPLVAMTYPIDKITDGKAQAFNSWLREYIFNLMIQPLHLLLYTVLVSSAYSLASESPLYALVAIGFMMPAEKLMRKFFGFEKASTPGLLGGAAGAAIAMTGLQSLLKPRFKGGKSEGVNINPKLKDKEKASIKAKGDGAKSHRDAIAAGFENGSTSTTAGDTQKAETKSESHQASIIQTSSNGNTNYSNGNLDLGVSDEKENGWGRNDSGLFVPDYMRVDTKPSQSIEENEVDSTPEVEENENVETVDSSTSGDTSSDVDVNESGDKPSLKDTVFGIGRGTLAVGGAVSKDFAGRVLTGIHPAKFAGKVATGALGASAGLMLGIASGDAKQAFNYTTTGAVAGTALASSASGRTLMGTDDIKETFDKARYGSGYRQHLLDEKRKEFKESNANIKFLREALDLKSDDEAKQILNSTGVQCFNKGIEDIQDVAAIYKMTHGAKAVSFDKALAAREYATKRMPSNVDSMDPSKKPKYIKQWASEFAGDGHSNSKRMAEEAWELGVSYNKARNGLNKV